MDMEDHQFEVGVEIETS